MITDTSHVRERSPTPNLNRVLLGHEPRLFLVADPALFVSYCITQKKKKKLHWENLIEAIVLLLVLLVSMNCHFLARKSGIWNTSEVAVLCSYLFLSIDCYWVSWQLSLMQALQMPVDRKNESQPVQSWITLYVTMNESLRYRTIQKALFQTYFMDENHFSAYTHSLLNQSAVFNIPEEELDPWYEKRTFWQNTECLIFMNYYYFSFTFK